MTRTEDWVILFGTPGVGKTTIAKEMQKMGYFYHEADDDLLPEVVELNRNNMGLTPELRDRQHEYIFAQIIILTQQHKKLVVAYDFMWDRYRKRIMELIPDLRWVHLTVQRNVLLKRVNRPGHILTPEFALEIAELFEEPSFPVTKIDAALPVDEVVKRVLSF